MNKIEVSLIKRLLKVSSQIFVSFNLDLALYSLSYTLIHLEYSWSTLTLEEGKKRKDEERRSKDQTRRVGSSNYNEISLKVSSCMYDFSASFGIHGTCMCVFGSLAITRMCFSRCDSSFSAALPFPDSHGVMGFFHLVELWVFRWFWNLMRWSQENSQGPRNPFLDGLW